MPKGIFIRKRGWKHTEEWKQKMSLMQKGNTYCLGKKYSEEHRRKISEGNKGKVMSKEARLKISLGNKGKKRTPEQIQRMVERSKGKHFSPQTEFKKGKDGINWRGGIWFEPYPQDWTKTLKQSIRQRDNYTCQICGKEPAIIVHHIDYNKKNCDTKNLIVVCSPCHSKTNFNRKYWVGYFAEKLISS
jgi:hypothetical protein